MSLSPIEMMLNGAAWEPVEHESKPDGLYATHHGVLDIAGHKLRCYRLNDGRAVFDADDVAAFFEGVLES